MTADGEGESAPSRLADAFAHCGELVRAEDPDRATALLFAAADRRDALGALYAFDLEVAAIRDRVSQPLAGEIRLQWWRDVIGADGSGSPVAEALNHTIRSYGLPKDAFERLLEARIFDLYEDPMPSREAFETYSGETASAIVTLAAMILDRDRAPRVAGSAGHAGVALTAARVLTEETKAIARQQVYVPADMLAAIGLDRETYLKGGGGQSPVREAMGAFAREHLSVVTRNWRTIPRSVRPAFLPIRLIGSRIASNGGERGGSGSLSRLFLYWRAMRAGEDDPS